MNELGQVAAQPASRDVAWDVFLSYAAENAEWVRSFEAKLKNQGLKVFDPYSIPTEYWGQSRDEVVAAIIPSKCQIVFVVLSSSYSASEQSLRELTILLEAAKSEASSLVLPVRLDDSTVPEAIRSIAILDATADSPTVVAEGVVAKIRDWKSLTKPPSSSPQTTDEEALVRALIDRSAAEIVRLRRMHPAIDAEEVVQQAIIDVVARHRKTAVDPLPFFRVLVQRRAMDHLRRQTREHRSREVWSDTLESSAGIDQVIEREHVDQVRQALEMLPPMERMIITSRYMDGMTYEEMAEKLGVTPNNLRVRFRRAITKLRAILQPES
jgi:RNA polymerase sigma factor (sigma-70 family)